MHADLLVDTAEPRRGHVDGGTIEEEVAVANGEVVIATRRTQVVPVELCVVDVIRLREDALLLAVEERRGAVRERGREQKLLRLERSGARAVGEDRQIGGEDHALLRRERTGLRREICDVRETVVWRPYFDVHGRLPRP